MEIVLMYVSCVSDDDDDDGAAAAPAFFYLFYLFLSIYSLCVNDYKSWI